MNMTVNFYKSKICFLLPTVAVRNMREYYGYNVVYVNVTWLRYQLVMKVGVKKVKDIEH
jgi:hypothetical protein